MNLEKKKNLASRALGISKKRIIFIPSRLDEIKEAITKQDIKDLKEHGAIIIKNVKGRKKKLVQKRKKRTQGNVRKRVNEKKKNYVIITRKLRKHVQYLKDNERISRENFIDVRKKIRNRQFRSLAHLEDYLKKGGMVLEFKKVPEEKRKKEIKKTNKPIKKSKEIKKTNKVKNENNKKKKVTK